GFEELPEVPRDVAVPHRRLEVVASLTPDQKQRRAGPVLPPHHQVRVEELGVEIARARPRIGLEAGSIGRGTRRAGQLAQIRPPPLADEWRGVHLYRQGR